MVQLTCARRCRFAPTRPCLVFPWWLHLASFRQLRAPCRSLSLGGGGHGAYWGGRAVPGRGAGAECTRTCPTKTDPARNPHSHAQTPEYRDRGSTSVFIFRGGRRGQLAESSIRHVRGPVCTMCLKCVSSTCEAIPSGSPKIWVPLLPSKYTISSTDPATPVGNPTP